MRMDTVLYTDLFLRPSYRIMYKARGGDGKVFVLDEILSASGISFDFGDRSAKRLKAMKSSGLRRLLVLAANMPNCVNLNTEEPDFSPPEHSARVFRRVTKETRTI